MDAFLDTRNYVAASKVVVIGLIIRGAKNNASLVVLGLGLTAISALSWFLENKPSDKSNWDKVKGFFSWGKTPKQSKLGETVQKTKELVSEGLLSISKSVIQDFSEYNSTKKD